MFRNVVSILRVVLGLVMWPIARLRRKPCDVLRFTLKGSPPQLPRRRPFWDLRRAPMSIRTFERRLRRAIADDHLPCILIDIERLETGWATLQTLHGLVAEARRKGKRVVAHLAEGGGLPEYYVACAAGEIWIGPSAALALTGLSVEATYLAEALERTGLQGQVEAVGRYKTAGETLVRHEMTAENAEMLGEVLDEVEGVVVESVQETRPIGPSEARELIGRGPYDAGRAKGLGLVDDALYPDQIAQRLAPAGSGRSRILRWPGYARGRHRPEIWPLGRKKLVVYEVRGVLVDGDGPGFKGVVGARDVVTQLRELRTDPRVAAVVLSVESRGGMVVASDQIRREVERLAEKKPVVAHVCDVAASGGYMIVAAAHQIVAQRTALTGSIGVLAGKVSGHRLLERLGLHRQVVRRGRNASFASPAEPWTADERQAVRAMILAHYRGFIEAVARGRRLPPEQIERAAEGRVWTGGRALELGLVDLEGGLARAIEVARESSPDARRALVEARRPRVPLLPRRLVPRELAGALALAQVLESGTVLAIEPFELRIR
jgi:protease-4